MGDSPFATMSGCPFALLGISKDGASEKSVLKAWRRRMRENHSDKKGTVGGDSACQALNDAKERALADLLVGDEDRERVEAATGIRIDEDRLDDAWEILTGQRYLDNNDSIAAEQHPIAAKWMDKSVFRRDIFRMMGYLRR